MSKKIVVVGSINMDLAINAPRIPSIGETILGNGFMTAPGGKGANQAVAAARLGGEVSMIGCVGGDVFGQSLLDSLSGNNVDISRIHTDESISTGVAVVVINAGNNCIIVDPGANSSLTPEMIEAAEDIIKESCIVVIQLEIPLETVEKTVSIARKHGVKVLLNPAPAKELSDELLSNVDILTPNESECEFLAGVKIKCIEDAKRAVELLNKKGVAQVIITLGGNGVVYNSCSNGILHKTVPEVKVLDTTAAGDSFSGAVALAIAQGKNIDAAVDFGNIVGSLTVTKKGAQTSLPTLAEYLNFLK